MEIQILKENLQTAAALVSRFTANKTQLPVLSHIGIRSLEDGVYFMGTNLDIGIRMRVGGKIVDKGSVAVPSKLFSELVNSLGLGAVSLKAGDDMQLHITTQRVKAQLQGMGMDEFPEMNPGEGKVVGKFQLSNLQRAWKRVGFSVSQDDTRPVLTGVLWSLDEGRMVTTDGFRLSLMEFEGLKGEGGKLLVSGVFLREALGVMEELGLSEVEMRYVEEKKQVLFIAEDVLILGRIIDGEYPQYQAIMPKESSIVFSADRKDFTDAVKTAAIFARDNANIVKFEVDAEGTIISANTPQVGENQVKLDAEFESPGNSEIAFNSKYILQALSALEADRVSFGMSDSLRPGVVKEAGDEDYLHVVMPVRVKG